MRAQNRCSSGRTSAIARRNASLDGVSTGWSSLIRISTVTHSRSRGSYLHEHRHVRTGRAPVPERGREAPEELLRLQRRDRVAVEVAQVHEMARVVRILERRVHAGRAVTADPGDELRD